MKNILKPFRIITLTCCLVNAALFSGQAVAQEAHIPNESDRSVTSYHNYRGLAELITLICDDAIYQLQGFFGHTVVEVQPFISFGQFQENKISSLGISLADQMMAVVNNDTAFNVEDTPISDATEHKQKLRGALQEVDGFLRIHISATNVYGERMSYSTSVEMSEPIYRAMHTYL